MLEDASVFFKIVSELAITTVVSVTIMIGTVKSQHDNMCMIKDDSISLEAVSEYDF